MSEERPIPGIPTQAVDLTCLCPTDRDLLLIRKNAADERHAINDYIIAAEKTSGSLCKLFSEIARDEMVHFRRSMLVLAKYDEVQSCAFNEAVLNLPPLDTYRKSKSCSTVELIDILSHLLEDELIAINHYQIAYTAARHKDVKMLFCDNANDEKIHVAKLWKALMNCTKENTNC